MSLYFCSLPFCIYGVDRDNFTFEIILRRLTFSLQWQLYLYVVCVCWFCEESLAATDSVSSWKRVEACLYIRHSSHRLNEFISAAFHRSLSVL